MSIVVFFIGGYSSIMLESQRMTYFMRDSISCILIITERIFSKNKGRSITIPVERTRPGDSSGFFTIPIVTATADRNTHPPASIITAALNQIVNICWSLRCDINIKRAEILSDALPDILNSFKFSQAKGCCIAVEVEGRGDNVSRTFTCVPGSTRGDIAVKI